MNDVIGCENRVLPQSEKTHFKNVEFFKFLLF